MSDQEEWEWIKYTMPMRCKLYIDIYTRISQWEEES